MRDDLKVKKNKDMTTNKSKNIKVNDGSELERIEEEIITAAEKAGKKNVIVNVFSYPQQKLKRRWHVRYKFNKKHLVMDLLITGAVLFLIGLNVFWWWGGFHYFSDKLEVRIAVDEQPTTLGLVSFKIQYQNSNKYEIEDAVLSLKMPERFELENVSREDYDVKNNILNLNDMKPGANGELTIRGRILAEYGVEQFLLTNISYYKTDKRGLRLWGQFNKNEIYKYSLGESKLRVEALMPDKLINNQLFEMRVILTNQSDLVLSKVIIQPQYDSELIRVAEGQLVAENLKPGDKKELSVMTKVRTASQDKVVSFDVVWEEAGKTVKLNRVDVDRIVFQPRFSAVLNVGQAGAITPGEWVDLKINYKNDGGYSLENLKLILNLESDYWDIKNTDKLTGKSNKNQIVWDSADIARLALLQPEEGGEISLRIKTKGYVAGTQDVSLKANLETKFRVEGQNVDVVASVINPKLNSNLTINVYPLYYTQGGDQLGRGPLPPRAGEETKYWIFVKMLNDIHDVENVEVSAELPFNVSWSDKVNVTVGNPVVYDPATKKLIWKISKVPIQPNNIGFAFMVSIVPTKNQQGGYPQLLTNIKVTGIDKVTGERIVKEIGGITTQLFFDNKGKLRDGVVK